MKLFNVFYVKRRVIYHFVENLFFELAKREKEEDRKEQKEGKRGLKQKRKRGEKGRNKNSSELNNQ